MGVKIYAVALPPGPPGQARSPMYEALVDAVTLPRFSATQIESATIAAVKAACARWEAFYAELAVEHTTALNIVNSALGEVNSAIAEENKKQERSAMLFSIVMSVAVIGFLGPAAGTLGASLIKKGAGAVGAATERGAKTVESAFELAYEINKEFVSDGVKELLRMGAKELIASTNSHLTALGQVQADPVLYLAATNLKAKALARDLPEAFQARINQSATFDAGPRRARAVFWAKIALWMPVVADAPDISTVSAGPFARNIMIRRYFIAAHWMQWAAQRDQSYWLRVGSEMGWPPSDDLDTVLRQKADIKHASFFEPVGASLQAAGAPVRAKMRTKVHPAFGGTQMFDVNKLIWWVHKEGAAFLVSAVPAESQHIRDATKQWSEALRAA
jgi:hypothetical protein